MSNTIMRSFGGSTRMLFRNNTSNPNRTQGIMPVAGESSNPATQISITTQPAGATSGVSFSTQPIVQLKDTGSVNVSESGILVAAFIVSGSGTLNGTKTATTDSTGKATFTNLSITGTGAHTIAFSAILSQVHTIWSDDVETDKTAQYFEVESAGGRHGRTSDPSHDMAWSSEYLSGTQINHGSLHLAFGKTPDSYMASVYRSDLIFADVTAEFDLRHTLANPWTDKLFRFIVFSEGDFSQAAIGHAWAETTTQLKLDPATGTNSSGKVITDGYNDFANLTFLGIETGTAALFGAGATTRKRVKIRMRLDDPDQNNGILQSYINDALDAEATSMAFVKSYILYGINAAYFESYTNTPQVQTYTRYIDNISVYGQARSVITANSLTVT